MCYCRGDKGRRGPGAVSAACSSSTSRLHLIQRVSVVRGLFWPRLLLIELMSITALMDVRLGRTVD